MNANGSNLSVSDAINTTPNKSTLRRKILSLAIVQAMACGSTAAYAANITVTNATDTPTAGTCTLREAINAANTDAIVGGCPTGEAGTDTINFDNSLSGSKITLGGTELNISSDLIIDGDLDNNSTPDIEINANNLSRVINISSPTSADRAVTLDGLTISGGNNSGVLCQGDSSGKYYSNLTLSNSVITGNTTSGTGGGINLEYGSTATINNSQITANTAASGGGIYLSYGTLNITDSTLTGNNATSPGGGIYSYSGSINMTNSTVSGNNAGAAGGGIYSQGSIDMTNSTVSGNSTNNTGGGIYGGAGTVTMTSSTVSGNDSTDTGGGIGIDNGTLTMTNSTISGNTATNAGGGIFNYSGDITMTNSTISSNSAGTSGGIYFKDLNGFATLDIFNSILANNTNADCASNTLTITGNNNLVTDEGTCSIAASTTSLLTVDPQLGALADNGGATQTHLPMVGSPVLDAGDNSICGTGLTVTTDQRGVNRNDGSCDIGAVEGTVSTAPSTSVQFDSATATVSEGTGTITLNLTRSGNTSSAISVDYTTGDGTAIAPGDYTADANTLNFASGVTSQSITISITDDSVVEQDENFNLTLSNAQLVTGSTSVVLGSNTVETVAITDDDTATGAGSGSTSGIGATPSTSGSSSALALSPGWMLLLGFTGWLRRKVKS